MSCAAAGRRPGGFHGQGWIFLRQHEVETTGEEGLGVEQVLEGTLERPGAGGGRGGELCLGEPVEQAHDGGGALGQQVKAGQGGPGCRR